MVKLPAFRQRMRPLLLVRLAHVEHANTVAKMETPEQHHAASENLMRRAGLGLHKNENEAAKLKPLHFLTSTMTPPTPLKIDAFNTTQEETGGDRYESNDWTCCINALNGFTSNCCPKNIQVQLPPQVSKLTENFKPNLTFQCQAMPVPPYCSYPLDKLTFRLPDFFRRS